MPQKQRYIMMVVPSLPEQGGGGVVQVIGYLRDAWQQMDDVPPMRLLVTRGRGSIWLSPFFLLRALIILAVECSRGRVALVHVNVASWGSTWRKLAVVVMASLFGVPVVLHLHGGGYRDFSATLSRSALSIVGWMFRRADRVVVLGETWRDFATQTFQLPKQNIVVVPNGVPDPKPHGTGQDDNTAHLLFLGRFSPGKGIDEFLEALSSADLARLAWSAVIAGNGDLPAIHGYLDNAELMVRTTFPGWLSPKQVEQAFSTANIFALPSHAEGLSIALLEAMAHGLAIVATPVGAHAEVIENGENGLLVPPGDSAALATALHQIITDKTLRQRLGRAARERFLAKYDITRTTDRFRTIYDEVMA
ncbi:MAG: glycosyltransferase family 4 protein [Alphaproteobacteria bacterium]|nr:glycosyltransferase family 4 protein [Alphaproteobacteria bacterium]